MKRAVRPAAEAPLIDRAGPLPSARPPRVAVVGAGVAGACCASALWHAGFEVTVFDKSRGASGRLATRRTVWTDAAGTSHTAEFDHGAPHFTALRPRFKAVVERAERLGFLTRWRQQVHAPFPAGNRRERLVPVPSMPAFTRHLLGDVDLQCGQAVTRLRRDASGWQLTFGHGGSAGPFEQVVLAVPAAQAAPLLAGHRDDWSAALGAVRWAPCWTLMAVSDDVDWPWDEIEPARGPLALVARSDHKPGREVPGPVAHWVAHASSAWSQAHLEEDPAAVREALGAALAALLPAGAPQAWHHLAVHRWRYARPESAPSPEAPSWWDEGLGLGVCGDAFGNGSVEAAWCSGDELADAIAAALDTSADTSLATPAVRPRAEPVVPAGTAVLSASATLEAPAALQRPAMLTSTR